MFQYRLQNVKRRNNGVSEPALEIHSSRESIVHLSISDYPKRFKRKNSLPNKQDFWCLLNNSERK